MIVGLPLKGEWVAINTPAFRVPSHGTDQLGQRYAYDFIKLDVGRRRYHKGSPFQLWTVGVKVTDCYGYGQHVIAPFDSEVVEVMDGLDERKRIWPIGDLLRVLSNSLKFGPRLESLSAEEIRQLVGNYVILEREGVFALFAHLSTGSVLVRKGERLKEGDLLGRVGHTGNSTAPHLHFQLMDRRDAVHAKGVPCAFKEYEEWSGKEWTLMQDSMPGRMVRIRHGTE